MSLNERKSIRLKFIFLFLGIILLFIIDVVFGSEIISIDEILSLFGSHNISDNARLIILDYRIPKAITAILVGTALSVSGLQMQVVFRNPLAGPYVLGISSGASLGVAIFILSSGFIVASYWGSVLSACAGAALVLLIMLFLSSRLNDIMSVLIVGILLGAIASSIISLLQFYSGSEQLKGFIVWTFGNLGFLAYKELSIFIILVFAGLALGVFSIKALNAFQLGEENARMIGANIRFGRVIIFTSTTILAGSTIAFCGPIGFVGIVTPHIARLLFKRSDMKIIYPATIIMGASVLLISDIISQLPGRKEVLPVGIITAMLGIPVVLWIIIRNKRISGYF